MSDVVINPLFQQYLPSPDKETDDHLRELLRTEGQRDRIVVWKERNEVVDGHRRLRLMKEIGLIPSYIEKSFADEQEVLDWMDQTQRARRNMEMDDAIVNAVSQREKLGMKSVKAKQLVGELFGVNQRTVYRALKREEQLSGLSATEREILLAHNPGPKAIAQYSELDEVERMEVLGGTDDDTSFSASLVAVLERIATDAGEAPELTPTGEAEGKPKPEPADSPPKPSAATSSPASTDDAASTESVATRKHDPEGDRIRLAQLGAECEKLLENLNRLMASAKRLGSDIQDYKVARPLLIQLTEIAEGWK